MLQNYRLQRDQVGLLVIDVQEKLYRLVDRPHETLAKMQQTIKGFQILNLPIVVTEQYPQGLGHTIEGLKSLLTEEDIMPSKTCFSCLGDSSIHDHIVNMPISQWILIGIEAHVCVFQTAKDLLEEGKQVAVLNDAITSRSIYDYSTAIAEMRDIGVRISSAETVLFELVRDAKAPEFKQISELVK